MAWGLEKPSTGFEGPFCGRILRVNRGDRTKALHLDSLDYAHMSACLPACNTLFFMQVLLSCVLVWAQNLSYCYVATQQIMRALVAHNLLTNGCLTTPIKLHPISSHTHSAIPQFSLLPTRQCSPVSSVMM